MTKRRSSMPPRSRFPTESGSNVSRRTDKLRAAGDALDAVLQDAQRYVEQTAPKRAEHLVLLADDDGDFRELLATTLRELGFRVEETGDGADAIAKAFAQRPTVIVMDFRMPNMDGGEAVARLAEDPRTRSIPILLLSSFADAIPREIRLRCAAFLAKPCAPHELGVLLRLIVAARMPAPM
jgi:CheY-like chemotaxis protein